MLRNFPTTLSRYRTSGRGSLCPRNLLRGMIDYFLVCWMIVNLLRALCTVFRAALLPVGDSDGVECTAHNVVTHAWQVFHTTAAHKHNGMLLQVVTDARNIGRHFHPVRQPHARNLSKRGIRFLRRRGIDTQAHPTLLWTGLQRRTFRLGMGQLTALSH